MTGEHNNLPDSVELLDTHLSNFFNEEEVLVLHEEESELVHSDIYIVKATEERPYNLLLTCGLSALPMQVPEELDYLKYAEILMLLPPQWKLEYENFADENNYWPVRALKQLSKYPHFNDTWLGFGHTIPLDDTHTTDHSFVSIILLESLNLSEDFTFIDSEEKQVYIYSAIPLYQEELDFVLEFGSEKLLEKFEEFGIDEVVDINRRNVLISE
jgi:hypothetical protein